MQNIAYEQYHTVYLKQNFNLNFDLNWNLDFLESIIKIDINLKLKHAYIYVHCNYTHVYTCNTDT